MDSSNMLVEWFRKKTISVQLQGIMMKDKVESVNLLHFHLKEKKILTSQKLMGRHQMTCLFTTEMSCSRNMLKRITSDNNKFHSLCSKVLKINKKI